MKNFVMLLLFLCNSKFEVKKDRLELIKDEEIKMTEGVNLKVISKMSNLKNDFLNCLKLHGVKYSSFKKCVGTDY